MALRYGWGIVAINLAGTAFGTKNRITATRLRVFLWALILDLAIPVLLVVRILTIKFEFACCPHLVGCVIFVNASGPEFDAVRTEDITHRPAVDIGKSRSITAALRR